MIRIGLRRDFGRTATLVRCACGLTRAVYHRSAAGHGLVRCHGCERRWTWPGLQLIEGKRVPVMGVSESMRTGGSFLALVLTPQETHELRQVLHSSASGPVPYRVFKSACALLKLMDRAGVP